MLNFQFRDVQWNSQFSVVDLNLIIYYYEFQMISSHFLCKPLFEIIYRIHKNMHREIRYRVQCFPNFRRFQSNKLLCKTHSLVIPSSSNEHIWALLLLVVGVSMVNFAPFISNSSISLLLLNPDRELYFIWVSFSI